LRDGRFEDESRRQEALQYERDVFDLVSRQVESPIEGSRIELAKSSHGLLTSLVNRGATKGMTDQSNEASVAREYIAFARSQLEVAGRQAKLELIQQTAIAVTIKVAALVLVLALARALIRLYDRGLRLSIQYEGIADSLLLAPRDLHVDFERLRRELTPIDSRDTEARLPRSVLHAVNELLADAKVSLLKKDPKPGA
jgi:hypothetical protein